MHPVEAQRIIDNLPDLLENTRWSPRFLACFQQARILHAEDVDKIDSEPTERGKISRMYNIIIKAPRGYEVLLEALKETWQDGALHILQHGSSSGDQSSGGGSGERPPSSGWGKLVGITFNIRAPLPTFTGRTVELQTLHDILTRDNSQSVNARRIVTVTGMGGVGKSQLCRRYAQLHSKTSYNGNVIWLNADSEESLTRDFLELATVKLKLRPINSKGEEEENISDQLVADVYSHFKWSKVLFVFDNVEKGAHLHHKFLPLGTGLTEDWDHLHFLLTSRESVWDKMFSPVMPLGVLPPSEASQLVSNILDGSSVSSADRHWLVGRLQFFPLAIHQAAAFIKEQRESVPTYGVAEYLADYDKRTEQVFSFFDAEGCTLECNDYNHTLLTVWQVSVDKVRGTKGGGRTAERMLKVMAYLHPDNITIGSLAPHFPTLEDAIPEGLKLLRRYALISLSPAAAAAADTSSENCWKVHRLVQQVTRLNVRRRGASGAEEERFLRDLLDVAVRSEKYPIDHLISMWFLACGYPTLAADTRNMIVFKLMSGWFLKGRTPLAGSLLTGSPSPPPSLKGGKGLKELRQGEILWKLMGGKLVEELGRRNWNREERQKLNMFLQQTLVTRPPASHQLLPTNYFGVHHGLGILVRLLRSKTVVHDNLEMLSAGFEAKACRCVLVWNRLQMGCLRQALSKFAEFLLTDFRPSVQNRVVANFVLIPLVLITFLPLCLLPESLTLLVFSKALPRLIINASVARWLLKNDKVYGLAFVELIERFGVALSVNGYHRPAIGLLSFTLGCLRRRTTPKRAHRRLDSPWSGWRMRCDGVATLRLVLSFTRSSSPAADDDDTAAAAATERIPNWVLRQSLVSPWFSRVGERGLRKVSSGWRKR